MGGHRHIDSEQYHDASGNLGELVHQGSRLFAGKDEDGNGRADESPHNGRDPEQHIEPQTGTPKIADVEGQAPEHHKGGHQISQAGQHHVGNVLAGLFGYGNHPPHIQLGNGINDDHGQDGEAEAGSQLAGKDSGLGQEARPDGGCGHQKGCPQQLYFFFHTFIDIL